MAEDSWKYPLKTSVHSLPRHLEKPKAVHIVLQHANRLSRGNQQVHYEHYSIPPIPPLLEPENFLHPLQFTCS